MPQLRDTHKEKGSGDAALAFLSASAGIMLLAGLYRLMFGELAKNNHNYWSLDFCSNRPPKPGIYQACSNCSNVLSASVRKKIHSGRRWFHLDPANC
jgi:hypothetical protein